MLFYLQKTVTMFMLLLVGVSSLRGQEAPVRSPFSNKGLKAIIATTTLEMIGERGLKEGEGGAISLGYGFTERFSMWLELTGSEHARVVAEPKNTKFAGLEINIQHKFQSSSRWQPYGKIGLGVYSLREDGSNTTLIGAGINLGLGLDYFFSRHFGVGAEVALKKLDYTQQEIASADGNLVRELSPNLNGDAGVFRLQLTIQ